MALISSTALLLVGCVTTAPPIAAPPVISLEVKWPGIVQPITASHGYVEKCTNSFPPMPGSTNGGSGCFVDIQTNSQRFYSLLVL